MSDFLIANEGAVRFGCFAGVLLLMLGWERAAPRRRAGASSPGATRRARALANFGLVVLDTALLRLLLPAAAITAAAFAQARGFGLFNWLDTPLWLAMAVAIVLLDLAVWAQHIAMHKVGLLWRLHRVHHSDVVFDASTGVRFHPLEILLSMFFKIIVVLLLGAPPAAVVVFEVLLSTFALFTHGNVGLPSTVDRLVRRLLVTPDMHRVHHSILREETDSNYGFTFSCWDRLFGTYRAALQIGHDRTTIGLPEFRSRREQQLDRLLLQPLLVNRLVRPANGAPPGGRPA